MAGSAVDPAMKIMRCSTIVRSKRAGFCNDPDLACWSINRKLPAIATAIALAIGSASAAAADKGSSSQSATDKPAAKAADQSEGDQKDHSEADKNAKSDNKASENKASDDDQEHGQGAGANSAESAQQKSKNKPSERLIEGRMTASKLVRLAKKKADSEYQAPSKVPSFLRNLDSGTYKQIKFKSPAALWQGAGMGYRVRGEIPGMIYDKAVSIRANKGDQTEPLPFSPANFNWPNEKLRKRVPDDLGYAGFSVDRRDNSGTGWWPAVSFKGASYFRARGRGEEFGTQARGLSVNAASTNKQTFPHFTHFWLAPPTQGKRGLTIYALLDSPKVVGAYVINTHPGRATHTHVKATLFARKEVSKLGVAPLTSMFTWGENSLSGRSNLRPEAHDADGLLIHGDSKNWQWKPLKNPGKLRQIEIPANQVAGFGLMQRDRSKAHYRAPHRQYHNRPNVWVRPESGFDKGHLELIEIPSKREINRNIELSWVSQQTIKAGSRHEFSYDMIWSPYSPQSNSVGHVVATHIGHPQGKNGSERVRVELEFAGGGLDDLQGRDALTSQITTSRKVDVQNIGITRNTHVGGWQLSFDVPTSALGKPLPIRAYLKNGNQEKITEVWRYELVNR